MQTRPAEGVLDLPAQLELPLKSGAGYWYWLGGRPALDLVNTRRERWNRAVETLATAADLGRWLAACGFSETPMRVPVDLLRDARELREAIDTLVSSTVSGARASAKAARTIDLWLVHAGDRPDLHVEDGVARLGERAAADSARRALGQIAYDAARMLGVDEQRARVRICASETCSARFYDRSPAGKRRWCSMQTCGNNAKARAHRDRLKKASA